MIKFIKFKMIDQQKMLKKEYKFYLQKLLMVKSTMKGIFDYYYTDYFKTLDEDLKENIKSTIRYLDKEKVEYKNKIKKISSELKGIKTEIRWFDKTFSKFKKEK